MFNRETFKIFLLGLICLTCAGCFQAESTITVNDDGTVITKSKFVAIPYLAGAIGETKNNLAKNNPNAKINPVSEGNLSGYEVELNYASMDKFISNDMVMYQAIPGKCAGLQQNKGWFFNEYSFDFCFEGRDMNTQNNEGAAIAQAMLAQVKFDFVINLPYSAESSNADFTSNEGKTLTWNLATALINGQDKFVKVKFKIWNRAQIAITIFLVLAILGGTIYSLNKSKSVEQ